MVFFILFLQIGTGIYDITGPVAEVRFFGYASVGQVGEGLHLRLRARAYHVTDVATQTTLVYVATDLWAISNHIKREVLLRLEEVIPGEVTNENLVIGCTHTHSGPGAYDENFLFNLPALGFCSENFEVIVTGIIEAIIRARDNRQSGQILVTKGQFFWLIFSCSCHRSLPCACCCSR